ncbi:MAG: serine/threonine-protein kinase [Planctomycetota bacterium]
MNEQSILSEALGYQSAEARTRYLDEACGNNVQLRERLERLLSVHPQEDDTLHGDSLLDLQSSQGNLELSPSNGMTSDAAGSSTATSSAKTVSRRTATQQIDQDNDRDLSGLNLNLDGYEVLEVLGRGGMGLVLKCHDPSLHRHVAIKVLPPEVAANPTSVQRFLREARAVAAIKHENVIGIHAIKESPGPPMIVMEYVDGGSLRDKIAQAPLDVESILRVAVPCAAALQAAHAQDLIHRDIKPSNILLDGPDPRPKLTDFGLARAIDDVTLTKTGQIAGTPLYMSPEQGQGHRVDSRSDLFSFGSVMYAMCTGKAAFQADAAMAVIHRVIHDDPTPIDVLNPDLPYWLVAIVEKLMEKDPEDRFQSAGELVTLLQEHLDHLQRPESHPAPLPLKRGKRPHRIRESEAATKQLRVTAREMSLLSTVSIGWGVTGLLLFDPGFGLLFYSLFLSVICGMLGLFGALQIVTRKSIKGALTGCGALMVPVNPLQAIGLFSIIRHALHLRQDETKQAFHPQTWIEFGKFPAALFFAVCSLSLLGYVLIDMAAQSQPKFDRTIKSIEDGGKTIIFVNR